MRTNDKKPIAITLDKLFLSFKSGENERQDILDFFHLKGYELKRPIKKINNNYELSYDLWLDDLNIGTLQLKSRYNPDLNRIQFHNYSLYKLKNEVIDLFILTSNQFEAYISRIDIALDTSKDLISHYNKLIKMEKLTFNDGYLGDYYGSEYIKNKFRRNINRETKYILHKASKFNNDEEVIGKKSHVRIENKKELFDTLGVREHIMDYLQENGIDTTKDFYRMEICIPCHLALKISNNSFYYNHHNQCITAYHRNKSKKFIKKHKSNHPEYKKHKEIVGEYHFKVNKMNYYHPKIHSLMFDKDYLLSLFHVQVKLIILNYDLLIEPKFTPKNIETKLFSAKGKSEGKKKEKVSKRHLSLECLLNEGVLTENQIDQILVDYEKRQNQVHNKSIVFDIFGFSSEELLPVTATMSGFNTL